MKLKFNALCSLSDKDDMFRWEDVNTLYDVVLCWLKKGKDHDKIFATAIKEKVNDGMLERNDAAAAEVPAGGEEENNGEQEAQPIQME